MKAAVDDLNIMIDADLESGDITPGKIMIDAMTNKDLMIEGITDKILDTMGD